MQRLRSYYSLINILSIDIALGAVCCALFFSEILDVHIRIYGLIALSLTVWIIYTADHLRDAKVIGSSALSDRHQFHFRYRKALFVCLLVAVAADGIVIFFMRPAVFYFGMYLFVLVALYLAAQKYLKILKEVFIAVLYTCGVLLPSISVTEIHLNFAHYLLFVQLMIVAWVNLLIFSWFDYEQDLTEKQHSFVTAVGKKTTTSWIIAVSVSHSLIFIYQIISGVAVLSSLFVLMNIILILLLSTYTTQRKQHFRWTGDAVFFIPGIYWLWFQS